MAQAMRILPDAIFCHKFWAVVGDKEIKLYLFDRHFEVKGIKKCMEAMPNRDNQNDCLPSQKTVTIEPIRKKLKPRIDHNYSLLRHVTHLTMIDWTKTDGFKDLPLLPSDFEYPPLENNMGKGKPLGPLLPFTGLLPFIMKNYQKFPDCPLQNKYREYPQALWPHTFSCSDKC
jgi:hypothetical protein